jgi:hypothetical protein
MVTANVIIIIIIISNCLRRITKGTFVPFGIKNDFYLYGGAS